MTIREFLILFNVPIKDCRYFLAYITEVKELTISEIMEMQDKKVLYVEVEEIESKYIIKFNI